VRGVRLTVAVLVGIVLLFAAVIAVSVTMEIPSIAVCSRSRVAPDIEVSSTRIGGHFEQQRIGPCVFYTHKSRPVPGVPDAGGGD
jgi:hypothetical protein